MHVSNPKFRILVVKTSAIGDIMHALRVVQAIRDSVENVEITWVARRRYVKTVEACTAVDYVYPFYRQDGLGEYFKLIGKLRKIQFDYILDMEGLARSSVISWLSKGNVKVGRSDAREGATLLYKKLVPLPSDRKQVHPIDILLEFCKVFGLEAKLGSRLSFDFGSEGLIGSDIPGKLVEIALCDLSPTSKDPFGEVDQLVRALVNSKINCRVVLLGDERSTAKGDWDSEFVEDLRGQLNLENRVQRVLNASLVVSSPGGPLHIASASGVPVIGLFKRLDPKKCGPYPLESDDVGVVSFLSKNGSEVAKEVVEQAEKLLSR